MTNIFYPLAGGILIGISTSIILLFLGKITGISGIVANSIFSKDSNDRQWRIAFMLGLIWGGFCLELFAPRFFDYELESNLILVMVAGLLVGFGTRLGGGCTSGHGVCGIGRRSKRSIVATITFMSFGIITVYLKGLF